MTTFIRVPYHVYAAWPGLRSTQLRAYMKASAPARLEWDMAHPTMRDEFIVGNLLEDALGTEEHPEIERRDQCAGTTAKGKRCSKTGTARYEAGWFCGDHVPDGAVPSGTVIAATSEMFALARDMATSIGQHGVAQALLHKAVFQPSCRFALHGVACKVRPDGISAAGIFDVKSATHNNPVSFAYSIREYGYHQQAAMAIDAAMQCDLARGRDPVERPYYWIVVEKVPPFVVAVYPCTPEILEEGRDANWLAIKRVIEAQRDDYPGFPGVTQVHWRRKDLGVAGRPDLLEPAKEIETA